MLAGGPGDDALWAIESPVRLWSFINTGWQDALVLSPRGQLTVASGFWKASVRARIDLAELGETLAGRTPITPLTIVGNLLACILWGGLLHLIPSLAIGVPVALGSAETHRKLGVVWGALALVSFVVLFFTRQPAVLIRGRGTRHIVCMPSRRIAELAAAALTRSANGSDRSGDLVKALETHVRRPWWRRNQIAIAARVFLFILVVILVVTYFLVRKCNACGGCRDDGPPRDGCYPS